MTFTLVHACLGGALAALAAVVLRDRSADARCWAWRLGLLKGPLALLLAVPVGVLPAAVSLKADDRAAVVRAPLRVPSDLLSPSPLRTMAPSADSASTIAVPVQALEPPLASFSFFSFPYLVGLLTALALRLASARRTRPAMPRVVGVFRPRIVIPEGLTGEAAAMAMAHERAHVRRRDPQWSLLADLVCIALWFAPPVWLCARAMRMESEIACDAAALRETQAKGVAYARLLLDFAGPSPANALGGPARRLARRILMLNRNSKPLPRPLGGTLLAVGLVALLPWQAIARDSAARAGGSVDEPRAASRLPARATLAAAMRRLLRDPEVRAELGLSVAQEETLALPTYVGNLSLLGQRMRDALSNLKKFPAGSRNPMAQVTRAELANVRRSEAETRRRIAQTRVTPLSGDQERRLAASALARFGSALWEDAVVGLALGLTPDQRAAVRDENDRIDAALRHDRSAGEFSYAVTNLQSELRRAGTTAARKVAIRRQIEEYRRTADQFRRGSQEQDPRFWRMRGEADARLESLLSTDQRLGLDALRQSSAAWPSSLALLNTANRAAFSTIDGVKDQNMRRTREAAREPFQPTESSRRRMAIPSAPRRSVEAEGIADANRRTFLRGNAKIGGNALDTPPIPKGPRNSVRVVPLGGAVMNVYRAGDHSPFTYEIEKAPGRFLDYAISQAYVTPRVEMVHPSHRISFSRWNGLKVDGPLLEEGAYRTFRNADGSTWTLIREKGGTATTYRLEHRLEAPSDEFPNHAFPNRPPVSLNLNGVTWTVHQPTTPIHSSSFESIYSTARAKS